MKPKYFLLASVLSVGTFAVSACDDGHVDEKSGDVTSDGFTVELTGGAGTLKSLSGFPAGQNSVAIACFAEGSEFAVMQRNIPNTVSAGKADTIVMSNVPSETRTVEVAVVNVLRKRVQTLYKYEINGDADKRDTVRIDLGSVFDIVNNQLFQRADCSRCHSASGGAAGLDLSPEHAYTSLVGVTAHKDPSKQRVKPFDASDSYLYKVLSEGDEHVSYAHTSLMADYQDMLQVLKLWIDGGAAK